MMQMDEDGNWQPTPRVKKIAALAQALGVVWWHILPILYLLLTDS